MSDSTGTYDKFMQLRAVILKAVARSWNDPEFKREYLTDSRKALKETFGYDCPFNVKLEATDHCGFWSPELNVGLVRRDNNVLTMILPPAPPPSRDPSRSHAAALAEYYSKHMTFF